jgi:toxin ParE1/3/4
VTATFAVVVTDAAARDLADIAAYFKKHASVAVARKIVGELRQLAGSLRHFPARRSVPPELDSLGVRTFRQLVHKNFRIIYHVGAAQVEILLIADGRRDMASLLQSRLLVS